MSSKQIIYASAMVGMTVGSFIPSLWGSSVFSVSSVLFSLVGGFAGIWLGYKMA